MSNATEEDYQHYLDQQLKELIVEAGKSQEKIISDLANRGMLQSGAGIVAGISALDSSLAGYVSNLSESLLQWPGDNLSEAAARNLLVSHLREVISQLVRREYAYRIYANGAQGGVDRVFAPLLEELRKKLLSRVRVIEIGVMAKPAVQSITTNNVTADTISGPILQGGAQSVQSATFNFSVAAVAEALGQLNEQISPELKAAIAPDAETIRQQLNKPEPSQTILQEAGKSIRNILENAAGGALAAGIPAGMRYLSAALGLS